ncbi:MAG: hypothetical protein ACKVZ0_10605 [Gemmatimonadales bacterium]
MRTWFVGSLAALAVLTTAASKPAPVVKVSKPFAGAKVNGGNVTMRQDGGKITLTLSPDVKDPKTPDPHWQIVDSKGRVFLLDRMTVKDDKLNMSITLPDYVKDVQKVVIYCAWAEANLGEAGF